MKGLVIKEPWIGLILSGKKTWEMRKSICRLRGPIALIRKGSGLVVGTAEIVDCLPPLESAIEYAACEPFHAIPAQNQDSARRDGWKHPWVLQHAKALKDPVPYRHPSGAVIWVNMDSSKIAAIDKAKTDQGHNFERAAACAAFENTHEIIEGERANILMTTGRRKRARVNGRIEGDRCVIPITAGNIKHKHIYLRTVLDFFPPDSIGGSDDSQRAPRALTLTFGVGHIVMSDIAGADEHERKGRSAHYFFRNARSGVLGPFFEQERAKPGDEVVIQRDSAYSYSITLRKIA